MTLHREGFKIILFSTLTLGGLNFGLHEWIGDNWITTTVLVLSLVFYVLIIQFFRNPSRFTPIDENHVIAPADGKVVVIEDVEEPEFFKGKRKQLSIFMSPLNVHVNRYPIAGKVVYQKYYPGKYLVAWHPKSSTENERTSVVVENAKTQILFRQIAGALARRIVCYAKEGDSAKQGAEYGFIKFGSRIDLYLPVDCKVNVNLGQKTKGGETILAYLA
ncbi:MAG: phosphatidylserine decarboxylase family protein [Sphingomonadales bacterium]|nr:phosphatidylserine decarboxylase family protein [Sphingomonadales bacterium]